MKKMSRLAVLVLSFILFSCSGPKMEAEYAMPEFKEETSAEFTILSEELFGINGIADLFVIGDYVVVGAYIIYNDAITSVSPDGRKMVIGTRWGGIMEIYSLKDSIRLETTRYFIEPDFIAHQGWGEMTENSRFGFIDIDVTDNLVYTVIDGETYPLRSKGDYSEDRKKHGNNISIFDWNGHPVRRIMTDYAIRKFAVDREAHMAYAVVVDSLKRPYLGRIDIGADEK